MLDQIETNCKLEHIALLQFSSLCELAVPFTREVDQLRAKLPLLACLDKKSLEVGLQGAFGLISEEWGTSVPVNIVIVTDGGLGHGPYSLAQMVSPGGPTELKLPIPFTCSVSVVCLADKSLNPGIKQTRQAYETLFTKMGVQNGQGSVHFVEGGMTYKTSEEVFKEVTALHYSQWCGRLELGPDMTTQVQLCPPPKNFSKVTDFTVVKRELWDKLVVKGFLALTDISSPPVCSRHLVLPVGGKEDDKTPNLCVFLHGALKVKNMCGLVEQGR